MKDSVLDFLRSALIPVLRTDVTAGTAGNVHFCLVAVFTARALPNEFPVFFHDLDFTVETAYLAVIALGVQFRVHDIFIDELHDGKHRRQVVLHIGNFHVRDCTARRKLLEFTFKAKLCKCVDFFRYVHVIAVGDIALIRNTRDNAKTLL